MVANTHQGGALTLWLKPKSDGFEKGYPPEGDTDRVWFDSKYGRTKNSTLAAAGALAMAANIQLVKDYSAVPGQPDRAALYLQAAEVAWNAYASHEYDEAWWYDDTGLIGGAWQIGKHPWSNTLIFAAAITATIESTAND